ncbi:MAG: hypothetical protein ACIAXF_03045 [Phycisphaerales bacterium JB063]
MGRGCHIELHTHEIDTALYRLFDAAAERFRADSLKHAVRRANPDAEILALTLDALAAAQDQQSGGMRLVIGSNASGHQLNTQHEDGVSARYARLCLRLAAKIRDLAESDTTDNGRAGRRLAELVDPDALTERGIVAMNNAMVTVATIGYLPAHTAADDPTRIAKGRSFIPMKAWDVEAMVAWLNTCCVHRELTGDDHPLGDSLHLLLGIVAEAWPKGSDDVPGYVRPALLDDDGGIYELDATPTARVVGKSLRARLLGVYGQDDGGESHDAGKARAGHTARNRDASLHVQLERWGAIHSQPSNRAEHEAA